jgi:hypothetical protein
VLPCHHHQRLNHSFSRSLDLRQLHVGHQQRRRDRQDSTSLIASYRRAAEQRLPLHLCGPLGGPLPPLQLLLHLLLSLSLQSGQHTSFG